jgi:mono/diheme cytochrome c family protein
MKPTRFRGRDLQAIVELVYSQTGADDVDAALAAEGRALFENGPCSDCHSLVEGEDEGNTGPNLAGRGSLQYLVNFIENPAEVRFFGEKNEMPSFGTKLRSDQISGLAAYVLSLRDASAAASAPSVRAQPAP